MVMIIIVITIIIIIIVVIIIMVIITMIITIKIIIMIIIIIIIIIIITKWLSGFELNKIKGKSMAAAEESKENESEASAGFDEEVEMYVKMCVMLCWKILI